MKIIDVFFGEVRWPEFDPVGRNQRVDMRSAETAVAPHAQVLVKAIASLEERTDQKLTPAALSAPVSSTDDAFPYHLNSKHNETRPTLAYPTIDQSLLSPGAG